MTANSGTSSQPASAIPPDDSRRYLALARPESDQKLPHLGVVGDTYTIILTGEDTAGPFSLIDMHVPPGGALLRIGMISRRLSPCWKASWRSPFAEPNPSYALARS